MNSGRTKTTTKEKRKYLARFAWTPIPLFLALIGVLWLTESEVVLEPPYLLPILNFVFSTAVSFFVAWLAAIGFNRNASLAVLLLGAGTLLFGTVSMISAIYIQFGTINEGITVFNTGLCLAGLCHFMATAALVHDRRVERYAKLIFAAACAIVLTISGILAYTAAKGLTPLFFVQGIGPTPVRQAVLGTAAGLFAVSGVIAAIVSRKHRWIFGRWYAMSLGLIAAGTFGLLVISHVGSPLGWAGRAAQYFGGVYLLVAVLAAAKESGRWDAALQTALKESQERYRILSEAAFEGIAISENGVIVDANKQFCRMLGYAEDQAIGTRLVEMIPADEREGVMNRALSNREDTIEHHMVKMDGSLIVVESHGRTTTRDGRQIRFWAVRDITDRRRAEEALERMRIIMSEGQKLAHLGSFEYIAATGETAWSDEEFRIYGLEPGPRSPSFAELMSNHFHPEDAARVNRKFSEKLRSGSFYEIEHRIVRPDGSVRNLYNVARPHFDPQGKLVKYIGATLDITERKRAEAQLRNLYDTSERNLAKLNAIVDQMTEGLVLFDPRGNLLDMNQAGLKIHGFDDVSALKKHIEKLVDVFEIFDLKGNRLETDRWPIGRALAGETFDSYEVRVRRRDTGKTWIGSYGGAPVRDQSGKMILAIVTLRDVTEVKRTEEELRESEEKFRTVFEQAAVGMGRVRFSDARWIEVNDAFCRMLGYTREELLSTPWPQITHPEDVDLDWIPFRRMAAGELESYTVEKRFVHKQGRRVWARLTLSLVRDAEGSPDYEIAVIENISEKKTAEESLRKLNETLEKQISDRTAIAEARASQLQQLALELSRTEDRERRQIAQILHDDLQQYLAALRFHLQTHSPEKTDNPKSQNLIRLVDESIRKCRSLSHELSPPVLHQSGLLAALDWFASDMREKHGLKVQFTGRPEAEPGSSALAAMLFRSVRELLFNVVKHSGADSAIVEARGFEDRIRISVKDDGKGFAPAAAEAENEKMTGFGLFTIKERIAFIGGSLDINSAPGKGCRVTLEVPKDVLRISEPQEAIQSEAVAKEIEAFSPNEAKKIKILVADDHAVMRQGLANLLENENDLTVVAQAADGGQAVRLAKELNPDVVLMDVSMPEMDGIEATAKIRKFRPHIRVIGLSMHDDSGTRDRMMKAGASDYIYKAAPAEKLKEAIRRNLL